MLHESRSDPADGGRPQHATDALAAMEAAVDAVGGWDRIDRIAVGLGPGSFTGLRIGIATARASGAAAGVPVVGICTLDALAEAAAESAGDRPVLAAIDARRSELFAAVYFAGERITEPFVAPAPDVVASLRGLPRAPLAVGSGALRFRDELADCAEIPDELSALHRVAGRYVCSLGAQSGASASLEPMYLRAPDAERWNDRNASRKSPN